ncbi:MAG TPA: hypothetical protein VFM30_12635 [Steroidobacteraceae bacterium]|nr:hypothetical protein [Steroidobacteraceae bacterium]
MISAAIAFAIVGICALVLDREYLFSAPAGVVEVAQMSPVQPLDEVTVVGDR